MQNRTVEGIRLVGVGAIFIDDIVLPDGTTYMNTLGGGVVHALMGSAIWGERAGLCALAGEDLHSDHAARLHRHMDIQGLVTLPLPQARAWQIFEEDGTRRELHRVRTIAPFVAGAGPEHLPELYRQAAGLYLLQDFEGIQRWADFAGFILWEPNQLTMLAGTHADFKRALAGSRVDLVSPNLDEARCIYGDAEPAALVQRLLDDGAPQVALRMGEAGSLIASRSAPQPLHIPAVSVPHVIDHTGAGNTYNGGLLAGIVAGRTLREAAVMGTVAASYCVATIGALDPATVSDRDRDRRYQQVMMASGT
ncbi:MAG: carbohydrate kinase family protein [Chloroflexota bacterium]